MCSQVNFFFNSFMRSAVVFCLPGLNSVSRYLCTGQSSSLYSQQFFCNHFSLCAFLTSCRNMACRTGVILFRILGEQRQKGGEREVRVAHEGGERRKLTPSKHTIVPITLSQCRDVARYLDNNKNKEVKITNKLLL